MSNEKLRGKITVSRPQGNYHEPYVLIRVEDESSRCVMIDIEVPVAEFALAITGLSYQPCEFRLGAVDVAGWTRETKTEKVPFRSKVWDKRSDEWKQDAAEALRPFEVDGWSARGDDLGNGHRHNNDGTYSVSFSRHVPPMASDTNVGGEK